MSELDVDRALRFLAERLEFLSAPVTLLLVAGGSALSALRLVIRTTKDVDIVALVNKAVHGEITLQQASPLPAYLEEASAEVARSLGLSKDWLNAGPASLLDLGLPPGCLERCVFHEYGPRLGVYFVSRYDQIHFKLYAAADQGGGRHLTDLLALEPTHDELLDAARWARTHDPSLPFREALVSILSQMGHDELANLF